MNTGQQEILGALHNCIVTCNECFDACLSVINAVIIPYINVLKIPQING